MEVAVKIRKLVKRFGNTVAVDSLDLDINEGEIFGLLGPNGSGKTTTLLIISTVYKPTSGEVYVYGHDVIREGDVVRKYVGIAFQEPKALWVDKPYELLLWHARVVGYSTSEAREVVKNVMEVLGLWEHRNKYFYQLSGGTRKKVEIAKVLIQKPKIAIFDEPTAQVDVISKHALWDAIRELRNQGSTVIIATNDMFEAERMCERIAIIYKGKLKALGTIEELKDSIPEGDIVELMLDGDENTYLRAEDLLKQYGKTVRSNDSLKIFLNKGEERAIEILDLLKSRGFKIRKIMVKEPSLDDVFFYMTGAKLKEG